MPDLPEAPADLLEELLSGDTTRVLDAVDQVESRAPEDDAPLRQSLRHALLPVLEETNRPAVARAGAGLALGRLGDPRAGVGLSDDGLPAIDWLEVEAGSFIMGDDASSFDDEKPQFTCNLVTKPFRIARYPITVTQYQVFIDAGGYANHEWWTEAGWAWCKNESVSGPEAYGSAFQVSNAPRVGVSWYEAMAFCAWLSHRLGYTVTLPSEAQWERAARHTDGRTYPWGNDGDPASLCNMDETGIGSASTVGLFPAGNAICGAADMSGNVWEWCSTKWLGNYQNYTRKVDGDPAGDATRVARGGSFDNVRNSVRCAYRVRFLPGNRNPYIGFRVMSPGL